MSDSAPKRRETPPGPPPPLKPKPKLSVSMYPGFLNSDFLHPNSDTSVNYANEANVKYANEAGSYGSPSEKTASHQSLLLTSGFTPTTIRSVSAEPDSSTTTENDNNRMILSTPCRDDQKYANEVDSDNMQIRLNHNYPDDQLHSDHQHPERSNAELLPIRSVSVEPGSLITGDNRMIPVITDKNDNNNRKESTVTDLSLSSGYSQQLLLPLGTVKALAARFSGVNASASCSSRNLHISALTNKQPSRKVSFKHKIAPPIFCTNSAIGNNFYRMSESYPPNLHKVGIPAYRYNNNNGGSTMNSRFVTPWMTMSLNRYQMYVNRYSSSNLKNNRFLIRKNRSIRIAGAHMRDLNNKIDQSSDVATAATRISNDFLYVKKSFSNDDVIFNTLDSDDVIGPDHNDVIAGNGGRSTHCCGKMTSSSIVSRDQRRIDTNNTESMVDDQIFKNQKNFEILRLYRFDDSNLLNFISGPTAAKSQIHRKSAPVSSKSSRIAQQPPKIPPKPKFFNVNHQSLSNTGQRSSTGQHESSPTAGHSDSSNNYQCISSASSDKYSLSNSKNNSDHQVTIPTNSVTVSQPSILNNSQRASDHYESNGQFVSDQLVANESIDQMLLVHNSSSLEISCHIYALADYVDDSLNDDVINGNHVISNSDHVTHNTDHVINTDQTGDFDHVISDQDDDDDSNYDTISGSPRKRVSMKQKSPSFSKSSAADKNYSTKTSTPDRSKINRSCLKSDSACHRPTSTANNAAGSSTIGSKNTSSTQDSIKQCQKHSAMDSSFDTVASTSSPEPSRAVPDQQEQDSDSELAEPGDSTKIDHQLLYRAENVYEEVIYDNPDDLRKEPSLLTSTGRSNEKHSTGSSHYWETTTSSYGSGVTNGQSASTIVTAGENSSYNHRRRSLSHDPASPLVIGGEMCSTANQNTPLTSRPCPFSGNLSMENDHHQMTSPSLDSPNDWVDDQMEEVRVDSGHLKKSMVSQKQPRTSLSRPKSQTTLDFDKLFRFKSDIRLNLSQAVGKIKLKVSSGSRGSRDKKTKSTFYLPISSTVDNDHHSNIDNSPVVAEGHHQGGSSISITVETPVGIPVATPLGGLPLTQMTSSGSTPSTAAAPLAAATKDDDSSSCSLSNETCEPPPLQSAVVVVANGQRGRRSTTLSLFDDVMKAVSANNNNSSGGVDSATTTTTTGSSSVSTTGSGSVGNDSRPLPDLVQHEVNSIRHSPSSAIGHNTSSGHLNFAASGHLMMTSSPDNDPVIDSPNDGVNSAGPNDPERFEMIYSSRFAFSEPLYQHYRSDTLSTIAGGVTSIGGVGVGGVLQRHQTFGEADSRGSRREKLLNTSQLGSQRTLWCELPEVQETGLLNQLKDDERKLQEAMFEVITSEASYLRSLNILITHFMACPKLSGNLALGSVINKQERKRLFSNILAIRDCSENLLCQLESRLEQNVILDDVCDLLIEHLCKFCDVYVKYCSNQLYQERTLNILRQSNANFCQVVNELELSQICESLNLRSFLMLPMQRITRYPLLVGAILSRTTTLSRDTDQRHRKDHALREKAFNVASKVVKECNEGAKKFERLEQLVEMEKHLVYKEGGPKRLALINGNRWLVKQGSVTELESRRKSSLGSTKPYLRKLHLLLFTDLLMVTKKLTTSNELTSSAYDGKCSFCVRDYCPRQFVHAEMLDPTSCRVPGHSSSSGSSGANSDPTRKLFSVTLMTNHRGKQAEFILLADNETERAHWLKLLSPTAAESASSVNIDDDELCEKIYESWDCPQAKCIDQHNPKESDELQLDVDEIVNILRKCPDGWFFGERLRDARTGWFPGFKIEEILSDHVRAKHYRQRLKLMHEAEIQVQLQHQQSTSGSSSSSRHHSFGASRRNSAVKSIFGF